MKLSKLTLRLRRPLIIRRVVGKSMEPTLREGNIVWFSSLKAANQDDVVLARYSHLEVVKRLKQQEGRISLTGDNKLHSTDICGVNRKDVLASAVFLK